MYSLYIPKYKGDPASAHILPDELSRFMEWTEFRYNLLVSPGYLSRTDRTIEEFVAQMEGKLTSPGNTVKLALFHGKNGYNEITKGSPPTILEKHSQELSKGTLLKEFKVDPARRDDHRKMVFFLDKDTWDFSVPLDGANRDDFLKSVVVEAVLIGSSNFSHSTYLDGGKPTPSQGEADLLLFTDDTYMRNVQDRILELPQTPAAPGLVLFESIAGGNHPQEYFKAMLHEFLSHALN